MNSTVCEMLGIEFPLLAFSHCRDVVAAVSRAGGMGVFGAVRYSPAQLREELTWIDEHCGGKSYGVDLIVPNRFEGKGEEIEAERLLESLPGSHRDFMSTVLEDHGIDGSELEEEENGRLNFVRNLEESGAAEMLEVAFSFPIRLIANALGTPPPVMIDQAKVHGVPVAALVGTRAHAAIQIASGVDILVAAGGEAGGHCGDVSTMVLIPEVVSVAGETPVLAAGGIVTGRQMAAAMAMGAAGAWCGSVWLTTVEAEPSPAVKEKLLAASSSDTVRSRSRTGKPSRQLRSPWIDAWEANGPTPLPMPLQSLLVEPALLRIDKLAQSGHAGARDLATYWVGQGVGLMNQEMSAAAVVQEFKADFLLACERLAESLGEP
ncbi:MAG TPA: nitronate monooxygenase [Arenicellales bacterium]|jgi:NAD(P)H-dependent flavin oxidoreductase YrpB (nitropropane dioxygenase family)|nr:monooxygenase [Acidiferrobacteraceae bacterium]MDP6135632.1 nitronate monooxygenase [Arenicellales bacterium]MDP7220591.1 nitronate monooxygenase [Arenicellales bacterium]HJP10663.1 nitronate monooxygenase [Arenicellales bacterium]